MLTAFVPLHITIDRGAGSLLFPLDEYMQLSVVVKKGKKDPARSGESPLPSPTAHCDVYFYSGGSK